MFETEEPKIEIEESGENYGRFVAEPLEPGFGVTLGNALRRVLLSSIPGVAVTWLRIDGVDHDFSAIPNLKEDTVEFLLNIKEIRLRALSDRPGKMTLEVSGEGQICAGDIVPSADFEIVNPEHYLATMGAPEGRLTVEFNVEHGKGYVPATYGNGLPIGVLPIDAIFTPVRKVNYSIKPTRVGQVTNFDSLTLEVWTDGTITPLDAVRRSAEILVRQLDLFRGLGRTVSATAGRPTLADLLTQEQYDIPVEQLNLSVRTFNCMRRANITKVGEILEMGEEDLLKIKNFGQKSLEELHERLQSMGLLPPEEPPAEETEGGSTTQEAAVAELTEAPAAEAEEEEASNIVESADMPANETPNEKGDAEEIAPRQVGEEKEE